ncbi:DNA-binding protein [Ralstonia solanacearum]|uniref:DNA-binding protein n=1 Tax=Ralstonia solanacearum TaxID=305 RepID=UPI0002DF74C3|nr:DNA-binding protein [Ralstonia solanacearum]
MMLEPASTAEDQALQADIAALRGRFTDTRELYREVCALLFFRYGVTPTANKLYSLVRKGSMSTPTDVLNRFWQDLREKTRVKIDHPELPDAMKQVAAEAVLTIWQAASSAATGELAALRAEARHQAHAAETARDQAAAESEAARQATAATQAQLDAVRAQLAELQEVLSAERQAHAATDARLQEARRQLEEAARQLAETRVEFGAQLDRERERADAADARARPVTKSERCAKSTRSASPGRKATSWRKNFACSLWPRGPKCSRRRFTTPTRSAPCAQNWAGRNSRQTPPWLSSARRPINWRRLSCSCRKRCDAPSAPRPRRKRRAGWWMN